MKIKNNMTVPRVTLILIKEGKKTYIYPTPRKAQFFLNNKAKDYFKKGYLIAIRVLYKCQLHKSAHTTNFENQGTYENIESLKLAFLAFVTEYMK